jgi:ElaA protein
MALIKVCKPFAQLTPAELYDLLRLRSEVFVVEQQCVFLDMDNKDQQCHHLLLYQQGRLAARRPVLRRNVYRPDRRQPGRQGYWLGQGTGLGSHCRLL